METSIGQNPAASSFKKVTLWQRVKQDRALLLMLALPLAFYVIFHYVPMYGVLIAFKNYRFRTGILRSPWTENHGFYHFIRFFTSTVFWRLVRNTVLLSFLSMVLGFPAPIILAIILNECRLPRFKKIVQTISYMPHFVSVVIIVGMMTLLLSPRAGAINLFLQRLGMPPVYFMAEASWFRPIYILSGLWQGAGFGAIIYLAALASINQELYEAAEVDGASRLRRIWHVSLPGILPVAVILMILSVGNILQVDFTKVLLMQNGLNIRVSDVISTYVYRVGLLGGEFSFAAAIGLFNNLVGLVLLVAVNKISSLITEFSLW